MQANLAQFKMAVEQQANRPGLGQLEYGANQMVGDGGELITAFLHLGRDYLDGNPQDLVAMMADAESREHLRQLFCGKLPLGRTLYKQAERLAIGTLEFNVTPLSDVEASRGSPVTITARNVTITGPREQVIMLMQDADSFDHLIELASQRKMRPR